MSAASRSSGAPPAARRPAHEHAAVQAALAAAVAATVVAACRMFFRVPIHLDSIPAVVHEIQEFEREFVSTRADLEGTDELDTLRLAERRLQQLQRAAELRADVLSHWCQSLRRDPRAQLALQGLDILNGLLGRPVSVEQQGPSLFDWSALEASKAPWGSARRARGYSPRCQGRQFTPGEEVRFRGPDAGWLPGVVTALDGPGGTPRIRPTSPHYRWLHRAEVVTPDVRSRHHAGSCVAVGQEVEYSEGVWERGIVVSQVRDVVRVRPKWDGRGAFLLATSEVEPLVDAGGRRGLQSSRGGSPGAYRSASMRSASPRNRRLCAVQEERQEARREHCEGLRQRIAEREREVKELGERERELDTESRRLECGVLEMGEGRERLKHIVQEQVRSVHLRSDACGQLHFDARRRVLSTVMRGAAFWCISVVLFLSAASSGAGWLAVQYAALRAHLASSASAFLAVAADFAVVAIALTASHEWVTFARGDWQSGALRWLGESVAIAAEDSAAAEQVAQHRWQLQDASLAAHARRLLRQATEARRVTSGIRLASGTLRRRSSLRVPPQPAPAAPEDT